MNWKEADGDNTYALDWPLNENSHVWEIGGFEGRWAQQIWDKFHCNITIFEPQLWAVERMQKRFAGIEKIDIRPYGLWTEDKTMPIWSFETDGASVVVGAGENKKMGYGEFRNFYHETYNFKHEIDLALMNIEGGEYTLIPNFVVSGIMPRFNNFWCQFHPGLVGRAHSEDIFADIQKTHKMIWNFHPTAVAWSRLESPL